MKTVINESVEKICPFGWKILSMNYLLHCKDQAATCFNKPKLSTDKLFHDSEAMKNGKSSVIMDMAMHACMHG